MAHSGWDPAIHNFLEHLPALGNWIVVAQPAFHRHIVGKIAPRIGCRRVVWLGPESTTTLKMLARRYRSRKDWGLVEFLVCDSQVGDDADDFRSALDDFNTWEATRLRLAFDVTDANFRGVFAENPKDIERRCRRMRRRLGDRRALELQCEHGAANLQVDNAEWQIASGLGLDDYLLPGGEISNTGTVDGEFGFEGWIVGTLPFGLKYGRIPAGALTLKLVRGAVVRIDGRCRPLCRDLETAFSRVSGLNRVAEIGLGQSRAVLNLAAHYDVGCLWHERHLGVHIGVGATLAAGNRQTIHHLDFVFQRGRLVDERGTDIMKWNLARRGTRRITPA